MADCLSSCAAIFDLSDKDYSTAEISLHCSTSPPSVILSALRQPPATVALHIVLWEASRLDEKMVSALGLGLKIQPRFFQVLLGDPSRVLGSELLVIGRYVVTMARHYLPEKLDATPVILITDRPRDARTTNKGEVYEGEEDFDQVLSFQNPAVEHLPSAVDTLPAWMQEFVRILQSDLEKGKASAESDMDLLFKSLTPLLQSEIFNIRNKCAMVREEYLLVS